MRLTSQWISICIISLLTLAACAKSPEKDKIRLGINAWPGYEFLYLASQKGFFEEQGLNIELIELSSLADCTRVFNQGRLDAMASSMIEAVKVVTSTSTELEIALVTDYSNGSDIILANPPITQVSDLKGKRVGLEFGLLGSFILEQALVNHGLTIADVDVVNVEQLAAKQQLNHHTIDAVVTYAPFANDILADNDAISTIFSTADIPAEVIDLVVLRKGVLHRPEQWQKQFFKAWQQAIDYSQSHPDDAYAIMAARERISVEAFRAGLKGLNILTSADQQRIFESDQLEENSIAVCHVMKKYAEQTTAIDCHRLSDKLTLLNH